VLDDDAAGITADSSDLVSQPAHDAAEVEVPPLARAGVMSASNFLTTAAAPGHAPGGRNVDDEPVFVELEAENASVVEGEKNTE
jgi:hypothetical protein